MKSPALRALKLGVLIAAVLGLLHWLGVGLPLLFALAVFLIVPTLVVPWIAANWASDLRRWMRAHFWAREQGRFHSFAGVPLEIEDDGRHVWVDGEGLLRAQGGRREPEEALAARHAGKWRRDGQGRLMLRVDAVVQVLATRAGRDEPRVQRLRRYLERDVLYPAQRRREVR
ncbi:conserved hypothetical protein [Rubrivivax sp. A210]|uniref:hypothetical protein n=1 Tax=Rubrivivax sp. A210 TaxID=2772301 RepID=UPI001918866F|nr:hypothetical protein [Rubrivivax sp. A210]CAD5373381.1 conserved hypothetical protein [Rubrivivax sp. A210]